MRYGVTLGLVTSSLLGSASQASAQEQKHDRPNILLFIVDDMGWQDTSQPFWKETTELNRRYHTPNMERLRAEGMLFSSAYASSVSSPTRCSLLTGANATRHGVTNWTLKYNTPTDEPHPTLVMPEWNFNGIQPQAGIPHSYHATSFVSLLKEAGYRTIHCGKAHFGATMTPGANPLNWGFDVNITGSAAGGLATYLGEKRYGHNEAGEAVSPFAIKGLEEYWDTPTFATEALTQLAIRELEKCHESPNDAPWLLYMAHYALHVPIDKDVRFYDKYIERGLSPKEAAYAALIEGMDKSLGDLLDWLDEHGEADHTVVLFVSDNGGFSASTAWRDAPLHTHNAPLRSGKGSALEGGIRVPMLARVPGITARGSSCHTPVIVEDFFPTLLELAGIESCETVQEVDGISFVPLLHGKEPKEERALFWNYPHVWGLEGPGIEPSATIRRGRYKLIYFYENGAMELYDLVEDISEEHNLATQKSDVVQALAKELGEHLRSVGAFRPSRKRDGSPCPWSDEALKTNGDCTDDSSTRALVM